MTNRESFLLGFLLLIPINYVLSQFIFTGTDGYLSLIIAMIMYVVFNLFFNKD